jgi:hypothetical protein
MMEYSGRGVEEVFAHLAREFRAACYDDKLPTDHPGIRITTDLTSPDKDQPMLEFPVLLRIRNPLDRLVWSKDMDIFNYVGLWIYLMSGSNKVEDINFYNPIARRFVDEETSATTLRANWGERIVATGALSRAIALLRSSPSTRRAIIPVLQSSDVGYESRNLPCLASIQFATQAGRLNAYVTMRSQAAVGVMPYDLFLLTMLHEYVAMRAGIELGEYVHFAPLTGIREREIPIIKQITANHRCGLSIPMYPMERLEPGQLAQFFMLERKARRGDPPDVLDFQSFPRYWWSLLEVTYAKKHLAEAPPKEIQGILPPDYQPRWVGNISAADYAFPGEFLDKITKQLSVPPRATA